MYQELSKFGAISEMNVCDNLGDHLIGNVYVKVKHIAVVRCIEYFCVAVAEVLSKWCFVELHDAQE